MKTKKVYLEEPLVCLTPYFDITAIFRDRVFEKKRQLIDRSEPFKDKESVHKFVLDKSAYRHLKAGCIPLSSIAYMFNGMFLGAIANDLKGLCYLYEEYREHDCVTTIILN
jgi:hypothetical protein